MWDGYPNVVSISTDQPTCCAVWCIFCHSRCTVGWLLHNGLYMFWWGCRGCILLLQGWLLLSLLVVVGLIFIHSSWCLFSSSILSNFHSISRWCFFRIHRGGIHRGSIVIRCVIFRRSRSFWLYSSLFMHFWCLFFFFHRLYILHGRILCSILSSRCIRWCLGTATISSLGCGCFYILDGNLLDDGFDWFL